MRKIEIVFEHVFEPNADKQKKLKRWLNRLSHPAKKGTMLDTEYYWRPKYYLQGRTQWTTVLDEYIEATPSLASAEEARKIKNAIINPIIAS